MKRFSTLVMATLLGVLVGGTFLPRLEAWLEPAAAGPRPIAPRSELGPDEARNVRLFREAAPSVVYITTVARGFNYFTQLSYEVPAGEGSGFVWDDEGHVVTNYHVVAAHGARHRTFQVMLSDHSVHSAALVGVAPEHDIAVLKVDAPAEKLRPVPVGSSHDLAVGQLVFAIGNPFGWDQTLTTGVVSALGRRIQTPASVIEDAIQTDAAINPGNTGGPLLDSAGRLIGMNTAIFSTSGSSAGIGFAVPVDDINRIVPQLIAHGRIIRPQLGIRTLDDYNTARLQQRLQITGVPVLEVTEGSAAEEAGLRGIQVQGRAVVVGDVIQSIDGREVRTLDDMLRALDRYRPGDTVEVGVLRDGERIRVPVRLQPPADAPR